MLSCRVFQFGNAQASDGFNFLNFTVQDAGIKGTVFDPKIKGMKSRTTIFSTNLPIREALRFVCDQSNLGFKERTDLVMTVKK